MDFRCGSHKSGAMMNDESPLYQPVDGKKDLHATHHELADNLRTDKDGEKNKIDSMEDSERSRPAAGVVYNRWKI